MELYSTEDIELLKENIDDIVDKITERKYEILEPTKKELMEVNKVVMDFIKENKRKIYGGFAQNKLIRHKNPKDAFYPEDIVPDIDFYSPDPIVDMKELSNRLYNKGFKFVEGAEAQHRETYKIRVNYMDAADISYVPKNIYNRIPYIEINGIHYVHPSFIMIDIYRMFTEPFFSADFRWIKTLPRLQKLQKHYPINKATSKLPKIGSPDEQIRALADTTYNFLKDNDNVILFGDYAYNCFLEKSGILKDNKLGQKYRILDINKYEFVSIDYKEDGKKLIDLLKEKHPDLSNDIRVVEHYPFWMFLGYSAYIYYKDEVVAHIVNYNRRCTPVKKVAPKIYNGGKSTPDKKADFIQIGSYAYSLLMNMIMTFYYRVNRNNQEYQYHNIMNSHLVEIRNYFFRNNKNKTMLDDTIFQEFIPECIGLTIDPLRESLLVRRKKFMEKKGPAVFRYKPETDYEENPTTNYSFPNSSGNPIRNPNNLRLTMTVQAKPRVRDRDLDQESEGSEDEPEDIDEDIEEEVYKEEKDTEN